MRLNSRGVSDSDKEQLREFAEWLLRVGSGVEPSIQIESNLSLNYIIIPHYLLLPQQ
jgi:ATP-dependent DNA helicase PIF1